MAFFFCFFFRIFFFFLVYPNLHFFFSFYLRRLDIDNCHYLKQSKHSTHWSKSVTFLTWADLLPWRVIWWWLGEGGVGEGRSRMRLIECRLRPFSKLWCFHGIRSITMCYEDRNSSKIPTKILDSGEFEHFTACR